MKINVIIKKVHGALAQLGARHTGSVEVTGSSPVCSTYFQAAGEKFSPVILCLKPVLMQGFVLRQFLSMQKQVYKICFISGYTCLNAIQSTVL